MDHDTTSAAALSGAVCKRLALCEILAASSPRASQGGGFGRKVPQLAHPSGHPHPSFRAYAVADVPTTPMAREPDARLTEGN
ncbi:hypothetical protein FNF31_05868 [Cafeteria roenbergensis]|uniref:Uncharacterized protein n=1 Tax=Cafeteria roenbergensis TaxID=33653 RepID=A0A5A8E281_CAFRO|nr:hypothetical protein FNF31_05868 [Cafeteria roenbergensis]KAA0170937.1 hypothetical protein FNF28_01215 [Cafeteria roenbergensis]